VPSVAALPRYIYKFVVFVMKRCTAIVVVVGSGLAVQS
jgi:hypothetical protein